MGNDGSPSVPANGRGMERMDTFNVMLISKFCICVSLDIFTYSYISPKHLEIGNRENLNLRVYFR